MGSHTINKQVMRNSTKFIEEKSYHKRERGSRMKNNKKDVLYLHIAVMMFSMAGVVAQFVEVPAVIVAAGRVLTSSITLFIVAKLKKDSIKLNSKKDYLLIILTGAVMAIHWTTFFQSIQVSSVAIGTITFSTFPLFITFIEPILFKEKLKIKSIVSAIVLLIGVIITIPEFSFENQMTIGILWGMISSFTYAVMTLANRYFSEHYQSRTVCLYEQGTAAVLLLPTLIFVPVTWKVQYVAGIIFVGVVCTALGNILYVAAQKRVKAQTAGLISGMETVYGILYALILLGEVPNIRELAGGAIILGVALASSLSSEKKETIP